MDYALIENGVVTNIIWLHPHNESEFPSAIPLNDRPVGIGDTYDGSDFYRDGEKVLTSLEQAQAEIEDMKTALNELGVNVNG